MGPRELVRGKEIQNRNILLFSQGEAESCYQQRDSAAVNLSWWDRFKHLILLLLLL